MFHVGDLVITYSFNPGHAVDAVGHSFTEQSYGIIIGIDLGENGSIYYKCFVQNEAQERWFHNIDIYPI